MRLQIIHLHSNYLVTCVSHRIEQVGSLVESSVESQRRLAAEVELSMRMQGRSEGTLRIKQEEAAELRSMVDEHIHATHDMTSQSPPRRRRSPSPAAPSLSVPGRRPPPTGGTRVASRSTPGKSSTSRGSHSSVGGSSSRSRSSEALRQEEGYRRRLTDARPSASKIASPEVRQEKIKVRERKLDKLYKELASIERRSPSK